MKKNYFLSILFCWLVGLGYSQTTVTYTQQTSSYDANWTTGTAGHFNNGGTELAMYANGSGTKQVVSWKNFTEDGTTSGTASTMAVGDVFKISLATYRAYDQLGIALLSSPTTGSSWAQRHSNYAVQVNLNGPGTTGAGYNPWEIVSTSGTTNASAISGSASGTINEFTFTFTLLSSTTMEVIIERTNNTATSFTQEVTLNNSNITGYSIYLSDDWTGSINSNSFWKQTTEFVYATEWQGDESSDWATAGNWTAGVPSSSSNVRVPEVTTAPVIGASTNAATNMLTITESDGVTINSGGTLIVNGTSSGNVTYKRTLGTTNWYLMSSPVAGVTFNDAFVTANNIASGTTDANNRGVATYDTTNDSWTYLQSGGSISSTAGVGYSVKQATAGDVTFTGTINTSDVSVSVVTGGNGGFNLLGVPFTSDLNSASFLSDNTGNLVSETLWVWNQGTSNYETKVTGDSFVLAAGQGFFVRANSATNLTIAESYQTTGGTFQRSADTEVKLLLTDGSSDRFAKIKYVDNATTGFDNGWDGETFGGITNPFDIFTNLVTGNQGQKYQVQSLPKSDMESTIVPVGITADAGEEITFTAEVMNLPAGLKVFLEDRQTNTFTRLDEANTEYSITLDKALNDIGRFYLHTSASALSTPEVHLEHISVYTTNSNNLRIVGIAQGNASVKLYNIVGKEVLSHNFISNGVSDITLPKVTRGIYIVQVITEEGKLNKKIIID